MIYLHKIKVIKLIGAVFLTILLFYPGCSHCYHTSQGDLRYLDAVESVSFSEPFNYYDYTVIEKEIEEPEEVKAIADSLKEASVKGVYRPGDSRFPDIGFPDYYIDFKVGELEIRCFYWEGNYILLPLSLDFTLEGERGLLEVGEDFLEHEK